MDATYPPARRVPDAAGRIRRHNQRTGRRLAVLDDDPTGSQAVHGVSVVLELQASAYAAGLADPGDTCFVLTNSRSVDQATAVCLNRQVASDLLAWGATSSATVEFVSRGDSTLRGHVVAEIEALAEQSRIAIGRRPDGVLFCPAMLEAGRYTVDDTHLAVVDGVPIPVGQSEFARDSAFGYTQSNLRGFLEERSGGSISASEVLSLSLSDIRVGGPERVGEVLSAVSDTRWVVVNALDHADLEVVALGLHRAQDSGRRFLVRSGPSFVRALAGIEARPPLTASDIRVDPARGCHGLVVVGSHVALTTRQVRALVDAGEVSVVELRVPDLLDPVRGEGYLTDLADQVARRLGESDVVVQTSREVVLAGGPEANLAIARSVSDALVTVVRAARRSRPSWILVKGGITGHDVAARALGIRRAVVSGQFMPGQVSLFQPIDAPDDIRGCPYVVFPGNVGSDEAVAYVHNQLVTATRTVLSGHNHDM